MNDQSAPVGVELDISDIDAAVLTPILGDELTQRLITAAKTNEDVHWIATHPEAYAVDGNEVQFKLLRLAAIEPMAVPFVRGFPDQYPSNAAESSPPFDAGSIPHLYQWDMRWGYTVYSGTAFALTGCCPTSFAMVYQGLTGKSDLSPFDMGTLAREDGYMTDFSGTVTSFLVNEAPRFGLVCEERGVTADSLYAALAEGNVVIVNVGPGDFTDGGHFIVACGLDETGQVIVNDPFSAERSARVWSPETLASQAKTMFVFNRA